MRILYKGYVVTQNDTNHHIMVSKDGVMIAHAPCTEPFSVAQLQRQTDFLLQQSENAGKYLAAKNASKD